jgi:transposase
MTYFVGLDVSQKITAICVVDDTGRRLWRGQCTTIPDQISILVRRHAGDDARIGIETGAMTPWLVHELRNLGLMVPVRSRQVVRKPPRACSSWRKDSGGGAPKVG